MSDDILKFFDVKNKSHLMAYAEMEETGTWPKGFIPEGTTFSTQWHLCLLYKMASEYLKLMGVDG